MRHTDHTTTLHRDPLSKARRALATSLGIALFGSLIGAAFPANAGIGLAVALDLPSLVKTGERHAGALTLTNVNNELDVMSGNLIFDITLEPAGVLAIDSVANGRPGTACAGTVFTVNVRDAATGEVTFDAPEGYVTLGSAGGSTEARQCVIDFTFNLAPHSSKYSGSATQANPQRRPIETTAHASAFVMSMAGLRPGAGAGSTALQTE